MVDISKEITRRARAVIIDDGRILLINRVKPEGSYWVIPGGKIEAGETPQDAVKRECHEELGVTVEVKELFFEAVSGKPEILGQPEFFYLCTILGGEVGTGDGPEFQPGFAYKGKYLPTWVDLKSLSELDLKPVEIKKIILEQFYN